MNKKRSLGTVVLASLLLFTACDEPRDTTIAVTDIELDSPTLNLVEDGPTGTLTATILPAEADNKVVIWEVDDDAVATITPDGLTCIVTAVAEGVTVVSVTTKDGDHKAECTITVTKAAVGVTGVELDEETLEFQMGETITATLTATVDPAGATDKTVTWSIEDDTVASITPDGLTCTVTALKEGETTVTVITADGEHEADCTVTVRRATIPVTGIELDEETLALQMGRTETATLTATIEPGTADNKAVTWTIEDNTVVTITPDGLTCTVTALKEGETVITVTTADGDHEAECTVTVEAAPLVSPANAKTSTMWTVEIDGGTQIWSDAINVPACDKDTFDTSISDCRNTTTDGYGYFYSAAYVKENGATLCPSPWTVPTTEDFVALDIALGGTGRNNQTSADLKAAYQDVTKWGGQMGGYAHASMGVRSIGSEGSYWSQTVSGTASNPTAYLNALKYSSLVNPTEQSVLTTGRNVRCVVKK